MHLRRSLAVSMALAAPLAFATFAAPPVQAVPGGALGTLTLGRYVCEIPDTADVTRGQEMPGLGFSIVTTSSYRSHGTLGSYLRTGDSVILTSGPRKGEQYRAVSDGYLRKLNPDGSENSLRCVRTSGNSDPSRTCPEVAAKHDGTPMAAAPMSPRDQAPC